MKFKTKATSLITNKSKPGFHRFVLIKDAYKACLYDSCLDNISLLIPMSLAGEVPRARMKLEFGWFIK
jgi:hypothetical protein